MMINASYEETAYMTGDERRALRATLLLSGYTHIRITEQPNGLTCAEAIRSTDNTPAGRVAGKLANETGTIGHYRGLK